MPIVSSQVVEDAPQIDGRRHVRERHTDDLGESFDVLYMAQAGDDANAPLAARANRIDAALLEAEHQINLAAVVNDDAPTFRRTTLIQFAQKLRAAYAVATGLRACRIGRRFHLFGLTNAQMDALFGTTNATQRTNLRNKFQAQFNLLASVAAEVGA
jgi:hypothetical protein